MTQDFEFVDAGRKFFCSVETPMHAGMPSWWWFRLDTTDSTRYAPFPALATDTSESVQERVITYYAEVLAIKARPPKPRPVWQRPARPAPAEDAAPIVAAAAP